MDNQSMTQIRPTQNRIASWFARIRHRIKCVLLPAYNGNKVVHSNAFEPKKGNIIVDSGRINLRLSDDD
jgi:hypothetical protein